MTVELSLRGLRAGYGLIEVLHGIDLDVPQGAVTMLLGANGAGKSTLLATIAGVLPARSGEIRWDGRAIQHLSAYQRAAAGMLLVPEHRGVFPALTVRDNLAVFSDGDDWSAAVETFPVLGGRLDQLAGSLSGGEQQMLAMSHPLLRQPRLLLLDEVSFGLAPRVAHRLFDVVADLARGGATVLLVEPHVSEAAGLADVGYVLTRGEVSFAGDAAELVQSAG